MLQHRMLYHVVTYSAMRHVMINCTALGEFRAHTAMGLVSSGFVVSPLAVTLGALVKSIPQVELHDDRYPALPIWQRRCSGCVMLVATTRETVTLRKFMNPTAPDEPKFVKLEMEVVEMEAQPQEAQQAQRRFAGVSAVNTSCCR